VATIEDGIVSVRKKVARIYDLRKSIGRNPIGETPGIIHPRWATHG
jgi:glucosamine 6-phosphate synthetase-like amidotransferase/phosphosugar isomerase protein